MSNPFALYAVVLLAAVLLAFGAFKLRPRSASRSGDSYAVGKKLRMSYNDRVAPSSYDTTWLVKLAQRQIPEETEIIDSLKETTSIIGFCPCGCGEAYFIDPKSKHWSFGGSVTLLADGRVAVLTVTKDKRVGSMREY